ncbi:MAG TPA: sigma-70 family RNA polymerase sigma factor [Oleiagrimonas sp.]|nr:sigma-70 family RNA polymerase sigma factor [Oleiagrimonas sp.]
MTEREFEHVLATHAAMMQRIAASYEAVPAARDDLLQDMAVALWRALPRWRGEGSLRSFIARIAHNRAVTHITHQSKHRHEPVSEYGHRDESADTERDAVRTQRRERLQRAMRRLPLGQRQVVTLALEGFSHAEIGAALDITANNVGVRINRARKALTQYLGETA